MDSLDSSRSLNRQQTYVLYSSYEDKTTCTGCLQDNDLTGRSDEWAVTVQITSSWLLLLCGACVLPLALSLLPLSFCLRDCCCRWLRTLILFIAPFLGAVSMFCKSKPWCITCCCVSSSTHHASLTKHASMSWAQSSKSGATHYCQQWIHTWPCLNSAGLNIHVCCHLHSCRTSTSCCTHNQGCAAARQHAESMQRGWQTSLACKSMYFWGHVSKRSNLPRKQV